MQSFPLLNGFELLLFPILTNQGFNEEDHYIVPMVVSDRVRGVTSGGKKGGFAIKSEYHCIDRMVVSDRFRVGVKCEVQGCKNRIRIKNIYFHYFL